VPATPRVPLVLLAVSVTVLAWASAFIGIRSVGEHLSPGALALGRLAVGTVVLGLLLARRGWVRPTAGEWRLLVVCRAAPGRRHHRDAGQHRSAAHRGLRRPAAR
jgi:drug/metabolite transporter (DMT)-like permease